ncbi:galactose ABC transporter substrate-binding protein [Candidatus Galacturonibacter soehngenii]|uniref:D-galactose/methyl-galactoside binding periplasmic protein MglB n=1 Tax=Candidatus Galacturonatibacter soehngenii TaxID=2307010 RepID=A0A7V7UAG6_9FIRM|nr:galactose ABC transporter substrate-binding protein [Candidatus Galacturonibacter soehngenii]KAB1435741.1 substrate-binding domain-containing protein [Candidatus Galacturonibacter soehngenii]MBA4688888.1 galactose ABC transporter substrate-binding protein [Candidatus Galacturonibacter soehngenii]
MKQSRKKIAGVIVVLLLSVCFYVGGKQFFKHQKSIDEVKHIKIGVSIYDEYDTYIAELMQEVSSLAKKKEMEEKIAITVDVQSAGGSQITQNDQIESFVDKNYNVVCVGLVDRTDASGVIDKAKSADIPIIFFNRELVNEDLERWDKIYYVGADAVQSGVMQGEIILEACKKNFESIDKNKDGILQYVIIEGEPGHQDALVRTEYSVKTVVNAGYTLQKLGNEIANWNKAQAITKMTSLLEKYGEEIEVVISNNDEMALGALEAIKNSNIESYPLVVGVDGVQGGLESVKKKEMIGTVYNDYRGQAKAIVEMAFALSLQQDFPEELNLIENKSIYLPYQKITYDNVQEYIRMLN